MILSVGAGTKEAKRNSAKAAIRPFLLIGLCLSYHVEPQTDWRIPGP